jgi:hypothetical protein
MTDVGFTRVLAGFTGFDRCGRLRAALVRAVIAAVAIPTIVVVSPIVTTLPAVGSVSAFPTLGPFPAF